MPSVTMNGMTRSTDTNSPLMQPNTSPANVAISGGSPRSAIHGVHDLSHNHRAQVQHRPDDISMPAVINTSVIPTATMPM